MSSSDDFAKARVLNAYKELWNAQDTNAREASIERCWTDTSIYVAPDTECRGVEQFLVYVSAEHDPSKTYRFGNQGKEHHGFVSLPWNTEQGGQVVASGTDLLQLAGDNRLQRVVSFPQGGGESLGVRQKLFQFVKDNPIWALGLAGSILYLLLRISVSIFYGRLGTSPEEVGYDNLAIIRQTFLALAAIPVLTAIWMMIYVPFFVPYMVSIKMNEQTKPSFSRRLLGSLVLTLPLLLGWLLFYSQPSGIQLLAFIVFAYFVWPHLALRLVYRGNRAELRKETSKQVWAEMRRTSLGTLVSLSIVFELVVILVVLPWLAYSNAGEALEGQPIEGKSLDIFLPWSARPADVDWISSPAPSLPLSSCKNLRFLGEAGDKVLLLETGDNVRVLRLPSGEVAVSIRPNCVPN